MRSLLRHQYVILGAVLLVVGIMAVVPSMLRSAVYTPPPGAPPTGGVPPLNTSSTVQTKPGTLTLIAGLTISSDSGNPDLVVGSITTAAQICWKGTCKSSWNDVQGHQSGENFLELTPGGNVVQNGWVDITGVDIGNQNKALDVTADEPADGVNNKTYAIKASDALSGIYSYGVYAKASANTAAPANVALYGITNNANTAWAGYFSGNVGIGATLPSFYYDLIVDTTMPPNNNGIGELCFKSACKASWPTAGDTYWTETANNSLQALDPTWRLAVGGRDANAPFYYQDLPAQSSGNLKVTGTGSTTGTLTLQ